MGFILIIWLILIILVIWLLKPMNGFKLGGTIITESMGRQRIQEEIWRLDEMELRQFIKEMAEASWCWSGRRETSENRTS
jgi:hypothetical protein